VINQDELLICRRRGHFVSGIDEHWKKCKACGMWVRKVTTTEERSDTPHEQEFDPLFYAQRLVGQVRVEDYPVIPEERAICMRRGHDVLASQMGWAPCSHCGTWVRELESIEEREDKPDVRGSR
jgi:hypothetical protein